MSLINAINHNNNKIISIIGMAKNAGKTVTLNHVIEEAEDYGISLGLTSTGRDGESQDLVTSTEKPSIYAYEGTYVATSEKTLTMSDAKIEIINVTNFRTPMGKIVIGKIKESGYVQIAGPQTSNEIREVCSIMLELGAELILIDGAINRMSSASPSVSQGCILATGAVISRDINKVIKETIHTIELFNLPEVKENTSRGIIKAVIDTGKVGLIDNSLNVNYLSIKTALNSGSIIAQNITKDTKYIVLPGSLVKKTVEDIIMSSRRYKEVEIIVKDGTKIFIDSMAWLRFVKYGLNVKVLNSISTLAVTINPYSPQGYYFDQTEFLHKMKSFLKDILVLDVMYGG